MRIWADSGKASAFDSRRKGAAHLDAVERVKDWTRARFSLTDTEIVLVSEIARPLPGCPPLETVVAFWSADGTRHHFTVFKPAEEVREDDVPPAWLREALSASQGIDCACC